MPFRQGRIDRIHINRPVLLVCLAQFAAAEESASQLSGNKPFLEVEGGVARFPCRLLPGRNLGQAGTQRRVEFPLIIRAFARLP
jgi:hypothetical protein